LKYPLPFMDPNTRADSMTPARGNSASARPSAIPIETLLKSLQAEAANADQSRPISAPMVSPAAATKR